MSDIGVTNFILPSFQIMNNFQVSSNQHIPGIPLSSTSNFNNQVGVKFAVVPVGKNNVNCVEATGVCPDTPSIITVVGTISTIL